MSQARLIRAKRVRSRLKQVASLPRLTVFRSNAHIWAQVVDDKKGVTLAAASDLALKSGTKSEKATQVGSALAKLLLQKGVKQVVFDRGGYRFHGRVKALAEAARGAGLTI